MYLPIFCLLCSLVQCFLNSGKQLSADDSFMGASYRCPFLSWQVVGLRVAALFLRLEVDDVPLDNVGMALDFDVPALLAE